MVKSKRSAIILTALMLLATFAMACQSIVPIQLKNETDTKIEVSILTLKGETFAYSVTPGASKDIALPSALAVQSGNTKVRYSVHSLREHLISVRKTGNRVKRINFQWNGQKLAVEILTRTEKIVFSLEVL